MQAFSDVQWQELKAFLMETATNHDHTTAFTQANQGIPMLLKLLIQVYENGRKHELPLIWEKANVILQKKHDPLYLSYIKYKSMVKDLEKRYEHIEKANIVDIVGHDITDVLKEGVNESSTKKHKKNTNAPKVVTIHDKK